MEEHNFIQLMFSQQLASEEMVMSALKLVNRVLYRLTKFDVLMTAALPSVKNYYKTENENFRS